MVKKNYFLLKKKTCFDRAHALILKLSLPPTINKINLHMYELRMYDTINIRIKIHVNDLQKNLNY